jgi:hypothetical protein
MPKFLTRPSYWIGVAVYAVGYNTLLEVTGLRGWEPMAIAAWALFMGMIIEVAE